MIIGSGGRDLTARPNLIIFALNFNYADYFERRQGLCGGALVIKGTRVPVRTRLASLAEGSSNAEILGGFATVTPDELRAGITFAAAASEVQNLIWRQSN